MERQPGDPFRLEDMTDDELQQLIVQELNEYPDLDSGWIEVRVKDGTVTLAGTVGTDSQKQVAEKVVVEVIGVPDYSNELVVNPLHRIESPEGADEATAADAERDDQIGGDTRNQSDTAAHLVEDFEEEAYGTHDMQRAIEEGATYIPPDRPRADGYRSEEDH